MTHESEHKRDSELQFGMCSSHIKTKIKPNSYKIPTMNEALLILLIFNLITFIIYGLDKQFAIKDKRRISEKNLHTLSIFGGFVGSTLAMMLFRHKIKKVKFMVIHSAIFVFWIVFLFAASSYNFTQQ